MTPSDLQAELRRLIDVQLEAIDQALQQSNLSWSDRRDIVGEVEAHVYELLSRRGEDPTLADLAAVLDSLDPPASYVPADAIPNSTYSHVDDPHGVLRTFSAGWVRAAPAVLLATTLAAGNLIVLVILVLSEGLLPWLITLGLLGWANYRIVRLSQSRPGLIDELRRRLSAWLMPKDLSSRAAVR